MSDPRRRIPGVDRLLEHEAVAALLERWPRDRVVQALRAALETARDTASGGDPGRMADPVRYAADARARLEREDRPSLRPVINATGVILHTNLGRAPLAPAAREAMTRAASGYSNLEYDLEAGGRGSRYVHCARLLRELTGAQDALVVNNNAAALVLALVALARGGRVLVSRGELVEVGGGFRIPAILERAGAELVEVGSTNRTRAADYLEAGRRAPVSAVLKVHRSNFRMTGFTEEATLAELAGVAAELGVPLVHDLGSGLLADPSRLGLPAEPRPGESIGAGADVVCFSGDKLLGGPQAGLVVGGADAVAGMRADPLCRALRVDKVTLAGLEATLALYRDPEAALREIPALALLATEPGRLEERARDLASRLEAAGYDARPEPGTGRVGGGTCPGVELPGWTVRITPAAGEGADTLARALRGADPPVVGRVEDDRLVLDVRTILPDEDGPVVAACEALARSGVGVAGGAGDA